MQNLRIYHIGLCATPGTNNGLQRAFKKVSQYKEIYTGHPNLNEQVIKEVSEFKPDIVFMQIQLGGIVTIDTIRKIRPHCKKIVNFTGDVREPLPSWYIEMGKEIDCTLFVSNTDVSISKAKGISAKWIQIGFDETIFNNKVTPNINSSDIIFNANNYGHFPLSRERENVISTLQKEFKHNFKVFGNGWLFPTINTNNSMEQQASYLRGAKIAISVSNFNHSKYISDRVLRIMGAGTLCISHNFMDKETIYKDGENIVIYKDSKELIEKCHYYLSNDSERERIALNGYNLTHELYTWDCFINNILQICE